MKLNKRFCMLRLSLYFRFGLLFSLLPHPAIFWCIVMLSQTRLCYSSTEFEVIISALDGVLWMIKL